MELYDSASKENSIKPVSYFLTDPNSSKSPSERIEAFPMKSFYYLTETDSILLFGLIAKEIRAVSSGLIEKPLRYIQIS